MGEPGDSAGDGHHPIRVVARRTGLSLHVLRAWERRYGVVAPVRTPGGQRLYSDADIERLRLLREAVEAGRAISQVAELPDAALATLVMQDRDARASVATAAVDFEGDPGEAAGYLAACLAAAERLDYDGVYRVLLRGMASLRTGELLDELIGPLLQEVGERWHRGALKPAHEHAVSVAVGRVLTFLLSAYEPERGAPVLVTTTLEGELHEFGALLAAVLAAEAGWRVLYLGPSLPAEEIARAVAVSRASAVAVSVVDERPQSEVVRVLRALRAELPAGVRLLVGGRSALRHAGAVARIGGVEAGDLDLVRSLSRAGAVERVP